jgi:hypothetical protein
MRSLPLHGREQQRHERMIGSLCVRTGASDAEVRALFTHEFARLGLSATVHSYLALLAAANVHAILRRKPESARADAERTIDPSVRRQLTECRQTLQAVRAGPGEQHVESPIFLAEG